MSTRRYKNRHDTGLDVKYLFPMIRNALCVIDRMNGVILIGQHRNKYSETDVRRSHLHLSHLAEQQTCDLAERRNPRHFKALNPVGPCPRNSGGGRCHILYPILYLVVITVK